MKLNKIDEVWNSASPLFKWRFGLLSPRNFATMATWRNDFSSLLSSAVFFFRWDERLCHSLYFDYIFIDFRKWSTIWWYTSLTQRRMCSPKIYAVINIYLSSIIYHIKKGLPINYYLSRPFLSRHPTGWSAVWQDKTAAWGTNSLRAQPIIVSSRKVPSHKGTKEALRDKTKNCCTKVHE